MTPFRGEKGTTWEGGFRIPMMVRWPGVVKPGTQYNEIISLIDWFPTLCAAAGHSGHQGEDEDRIRRRGGKNFRVHLDGYNFMPLLQGREQEAAARRDLLLRSGRQSQRHPLERLEAELRIARREISRPAHAR